jgi:adenylylsulfate kinase-like enzyme
MTNLGKGRVFLLTGLSGSGKSTLGNLLVSHLNKYGVRDIFLLDGDASRAFFEGDLSYLPEDRDAMTKRMAFAAFTLTENNIDVVMANIARKKELRQFIRKKIPDYIEIFHDADITTLIEKDVKGTYRNNLSSKNPMIVGVDIPYDRPEYPDVIVYPYKESPQESLKRVLEYLAGRGAIMGTKSETLESLRHIIKMAKVLPQVTITWDLLSGDPANIIKQIEDEIGCGPYILRSSCQCEDNNIVSNAGMFTSVSGVTSDVSDFVNAANTVLESYKKNNIPKPGSEQILIQPMLTDVQMSGVICTRYKSADSPYYVINYDDSTGKTNTITSGAGGNIIYISRFIQREDLKEWEPLFNAIKELETIYHKYPLDIEFAILNTKEIVILQCRPLLVEPSEKLLEESAGELIQELKLRFIRCQLPDPHLPGKETVLSDMADWNPSEIIGDRPSTLSYSLYRELVTDKTWHESRTSQGYFDLVQANLMLSMARKPYIDTRMSFASFTPADLSSTTRNKLVDYYLDTLKKNQHLHDKIEFEILYTCYDLGVEKRIQQCERLTLAERTEVIESLKRLTNHLVLSLGKSIKEDFDNLKKLEVYLTKIKTEYSGKQQYWDHFNAAYLLLEHTRKLGVLPFARLARLAFIGRTLLYSLSEKGIKSREFCNEFLGSIDTIATQFSLDLDSFQIGDMTQDVFLQKYGHLRMNTYDICSPRYDQIPLAHWKCRHTPKPVKQKLVIKDTSAIDKSLSDCGLTFNAEQLFNFIITATQTREESKYQFTRALSEAIEHLAKGGELLGLTRQEVQYITLPVLLRFRNPEFGSSAKSVIYLRKKIKEKAHERSVFNLIKLPSVITEPKDIELVRFQASKPNFITGKCVTAQSLYLQCPTDSISSEFPSLEGKIIIIENADPGYDWIFTHKISGLITKYGGAASHMAIRCNEFGLPGAIGCGELIFSRLIESEIIRLDCKSEVIDTL